MALGNQKGAGFWGWDRRRETAAVRDRTCSENRPLEGMRWLGGKENPRNAHSSSHSDSKVKGQGVSLRLRTSQATSVSWIIRVLKETESYPAGGERGGSRGGKIQPWPISTALLTIWGKFAPKL